MDDSAVATDIAKTASVGAEAVYRVTAAAGFDPALAEALRRAAIDIITGVSALETSMSHRIAARRDELRINIVSIQELLGVGGRLSMLSAENLDRISSAYQRLDRWLGGGTPRGSHQTGDSDYEDSGSGSGSGLNERQRQILAFLGQNGRGQISDIRGLFGEACSEKTLQRDLWQLVNSGLIKREGDNRWTMYVSIGHFDVR